MDINKCQFCEKYYSGSNRTMECHASNFELKLDNACKDALDRMMLVLTAERCKKED